MPKNAGRLPDGTILQGREGVEKRRAFVMECKLRGLKVDTIAKLIGVHRNTITNDLKAIAKKQAEAIREIDVDATIGETMEYYDRLRDQALVEYGSAETHGGKLGFLNAALKAQEMKAKLLMDVGVIPKVAQTTRGGPGTSLDDATDLSKIPTSDLEAARERLQSDVGMFGPEDD